MLSRRRRFRSSVGSKVLIGATGLALFLYLITHVAGNLLIFLGPQVFNQYAHTLTSNPLVPIVEIGLLLIFVVHVYKTIRMYLANQQARPVRYVKKVYAGPPSRKTLASSTMIASGLWLLLFVIVHVRTFKYGPEYRAAGASDAAGVFVRDLYRVEMESFSHPLTVGFYVLSMILVGSHLWHGVASGFQSLGAPGAEDPRRTRLVLRTGRVAAVAIAAAFTTIVLWAYFLASR
jgi:succinate dehydrogenase / fumarate reductase, cytochrome b subunit